MRTIKFRGKNTNKNEWVNGDLVVVEDGMHNVVRAKIITHCFTKSFQGGDFDHYSISTLVKPESIGQFTGLRDKNGNEIYEGDVIRGKYHTTHLIQYNEKEASFFAYSLPISEFSFRGHFYQDWINEFDKVVIGNIHDNPELLKNND